MFSLLYNFQLMMPLVPMTQTVCLVRKLVLTAFQFFIDYLKPLVNRSFIGARNTRGR